MNSYSLSLDISTSNMGICLWDEKGVLVEMNHLELKVDKKIPPEDRYISKADQLSSYLIKFKKKIVDTYEAEINNIFVEAPLQNTPKNINTTALLLGFNGIVCYMLYQIFDIIPKKISVHESRKLFLPEFVKTKKVKKEIKATLSFPKGWKSDEKKEYIRRKVELLEPQIDWFYTRNETINKKSYDMSDSYVVGISSLIVMDILDYDLWKDKLSNINVNVDGIK